MTPHRKKSPEELRSYRWLGRDDLRSFGHRSRLQQMGHDHEKTEFNLLEFFT